MNMRGIPRYTLVWGARYTLGARYLSKNTVICITFCEEKFTKYPLKMLKFCPQKGSHV